MSDTETVSIAEGKIVFRDQVLVTYALGSCVGVCLYEKNKKIAGMAHILLPHNESRFPDANVFKFADTGIKELFRRMLVNGASRKNIVAKIVGGAEMFRTPETKTSIGERNVMAVRETLRNLSIPIIADRTGSNYGRSIWFYCEDGSLKVKTVNNGVEII